MNLRVLTLDEFLGCCDDTVGRFYEAGTPVAVKVLSEAYLRLMEMESDLLEIRAIVENYDE